MPMPVTTWEGLEMKFPHILKYWGKSMQPHQRWRSCSKNNLVKGQSFVKLKKQDDNKSVTLPNWQQFRFHLRQFLPSLWLRCRQCAFGKPLWWKAKTQPAKTTHWPNFRSPTGFHQPWPPWLACPAADLTSCGHSRSPRWSCKKPSPIETVWLSCGRNVMA